jgi:hypothetical protein
MDRLLSAVLDPPTRSRCLAARSKPAKSQPTPGCGAAGWLKLMGCKTDALCPVYGSSRLTYVLLANQP